MYIGSVLARLTDSPFMRVPMGKGKGLHPQTEITSLQLFPPIHYFCQKPSPMKKSTIAVIALLIGLSFSACIFKKATKSTPDYAAEGYVKAMVVTMELDGCTYMLELESDKSKLEPDGLQPEFQKDSLPVWIKYKAAPDRMSICMAGATIDLIDIKKR